jgi:hypothetical protein
MALTIRKIAIAMISRPVAAAATPYISSFLKQKLGGG